MSAWAPVIYGRTHQVDEWWRALPAGSSARGWLGEAVLAAVAGGNGLVRYRDEPGAPVKNTPRFILARGTGGTLVGLSCRARALSEELCQDRYGREIYCFTGWFTADQAASDIPALDEFTARPDSWAAAAYVRYSQPVWQATSVSVQETVPGAAPWAPSRREPGLREPGKADKLTVLAQQVRFHPSAMAAQLWRAGLETPWPFTLVVGWQVARHASLDQITHLCADDITEVTTASRRWPSAEPPSAPAGPGEPDRIKAGSRLHLDTTRLARDARAAQERARHQGDHDGPSWPCLSRVVHWLGQIAGGQPEPGGQQWQPQDRSAAAAPGPARPEPRPVEIQLPKRQEAAEPFEGLE